MVVYFICIKLKSKLELMHSLVASGFCSLGCAFARMMHLNANCWHLDVNLVDSHSVFSTHYMVEVVLQYA